MANLNLLVLDANGRSKRRASQDQNIDFSTINVSGSSAGGLITGTNTNTAGNLLKLTHTGNGSTGRVIQIEQNGTAIGIQVNRNVTSGGRYAIAGLNRDITSGAGGVRGEMRGGHVLSGGVFGINTNVNISTSGTLNETTTVSNLSTTVDLAVGFSVAGTNIPVGTTIASIVDGTTITLSNAATGSGTVTLTITYAGNSAAVAACNFATGPNARNLALVNSSYYWVGFNAPSGAFTSYTVTFPNAQGSADTYLKNDGSGNLTWSSAGSGLTAGDGISISGSTISLATGSGGAGLTYTSGVLAVGAGTGIKVSADAVSIDYTIPLTNNSGEAIAAGDVVIYTVAGGITAKATAVGSALSISAVGVAESSIADGATGNVVVRSGAIVAVNGTATAGRTYYVVNPDDETTFAGSVTSSWDAFTAGNQIFKIGTAVSATEILFDPEYIMEY